ncbi:hypothetical protein HPP92_019714 [Vanilla planifolia]|uniref:Glutaredoxin domain-containing protein n=1 Tax=Vanilla planifolia TaxID=51239 RepID=A0A835UK37_VANPL|nr:hypothetical protein HPP92_019714 [Vanilla planifolia]
MWARWGKISGGSGAGAVETAHAVAPSTPSFKDLPALLRDEYDAGTAGADATGRRRSAVVFHRVRIATAALRTWRSLPSSVISEPVLKPAGEDKRIVVYYTSLRVVRKTFVDCRDVRSILRGFRVAIDERDLAMDSAFLSELKGILGRRQLTLPQVFIGGRYIGGADEIWKLHESGELKRYVEGVPSATNGTCEPCGGMRFLLCQNCNGSHKYYSEKGGFRTCTSCNENGLVRCPLCCFSAV